MDLVQRDVSDLLETFVRKVNKHILPIYAPLLTKSTDVDYNIRLPTYIIYNDYSYTQSVHYADTAADDDSSSTDTAKLICGIIIGGISLVGGVYLLLADEYRQISSTNLDTDLNQISTGVHQNFSLELVGQMSIVEKNYLNWKNKFVGRTYGLAASKVGGMIGGLSVGIGLCVGSATVMTGGAVGVIGAGCLFVWNYFGSDDKVTEEKLFEIFLVSVIQLQNQILLQSQLHRSVDQMNQNVNPIFVPGGYGNVYPIY